MARFRAWQNAYFEPQETTRAAVEWAGTGACARLSHPDR